MRRAVRASWSPDPPPRWSPDPPPRRLHLSATLSLQTAKGPRGKQKDHGSQGASWPDCLAGGELLGQKPPPQVLGSGEGPGRAGAAPHQWAPMPGQKGHCGAALGLDASRRGFAGSRDRARLLLLLRQLRDSVQHAPGAGRKSPLRRAPKSRAWRRQPFYVQQPSSQAPFPGSKTRLTSVRHSWGTPKRTTSVVLSPSTAPP